MRDHFSGDADVNTGLNASDLDTAYGCGRMVDVCSGVGGASIRD